MTNLNNISIPCPGTQSVKIRYSPLPRQVNFEPENWASEWLGNNGSDWWGIDLSKLNLPDGEYEYEFVVKRYNKEIVVADPYAEEITRFGGYRGVFLIKGGQRVRHVFSWDGEIPYGKRLPNNNEISIYELPIRWVDSVDSCPECYDRHVGLGTFDKTIFERLEYFISLGINAIELLPVQDSPDTLNWGYGTRFFFTTDYDMGEPFDLKLFVKLCHQNGIRVIMDIVMNHARKCPLLDLAKDWFFIDKQDERDSWGGNLFLYDWPVNGDFYSRSFHYDVAEFLIKEYHIDGFRIDEFKGIKNYDFVEEFRRRAWDIHQKTFSDRPFIVIAEDSWRRTEITQDINLCNNKICKVVDSMWDFTFQEELRRLVTDSIYTNWGNPSRSERVKAIISVDKDIRRNGFSDMSQRVTYCTSHDIEADLQQRLFPFLIQHMRNEHDVENQAIAFRQMMSAFAIMLTTAGIPMFLGGEEFAELQDVDHGNSKEKMSSGIDWRRADLPGRDELRKRVTELIGLRTRHPALHRNEVEFFYFHPRFDDNDEARVFAYCRTGERNPGSPGQVIVVANCGPQSYTSFTIEWPWGSSPLTEHDGMRQSLPKIIGNKADLELFAYQVRVFSC